jgi:uncharacterized membrane protein SpoIIM required for sporulation
MGIRQSKMQQSARQIVLFGFSFFCLRRNYMDGNMHKSKEEIKEEKKKKTWQGKIASAKIDASQGASLFKVLAFLSAFAGIPLAYVGNSTLIILGGFVVGFLFLGVSYILQAQEVIIFKLYDNSQDGVENNDN